MPAIDRLAAVAAEIDSLEDRLGRLRQLRSDLIVRAQTEGATYDRLATAARRGRPRISQLLKHAKEQATMLR